jgi:hypothetical protein
MKKGSIRYIVVCVGAVLLIASYGCKKADNPGKVNIQETSKAAEIPKINRNQTDTLGERIRNSESLYGLSKYSREMAVARYVKPVRLNPVMHKFHSGLSNLQKVDSELIMKLRGEIKDRRIEQKIQKDIESVAEYLIPLIDKSIESLFQDAEDAEQKIGPNPSKAGLSDEDLFKTLSTVLLAYSHINRLVDYRDVLVAKLILTLQSLASAGKSDTSDPGTVIGDLEIKRTHNEEELSLVKRELDKMESAYQIQIQMLSLTYGRRQVDDELNLTRTKLNHIENVSQELKDRRNQLAMDSVLMAEKLLSDRLKELERYYVDSEEPLPRSHSSLFYPLSPEEESKKNPLLVAWDRLSADMIYSLRERAGLFSKLLPHLQKRNQILKALMEVSNPESTEAFPFMALQLQTEQTLQDQFASLWEDVMKGSPSRGVQGYDMKRAEYYENLVDLGINMEAVLPIEIRQLSAIGPFLQAISSSEQINPQHIETVSSLMLKLSSELEHIKRQMKLFVSKTENEKPIWDRYDSFLNELMRERIRIWEKMETVFTVMDEQKESGSDIRFSDALTSKLGEAVSNRLSTARNDLQRKMKIREDMKTNPAVQILYGQPKYREWSHSMQFADYIHQVTGEIADNEEILRNLIKATDSALSQETRGLALMNLVLPLNFSWNVERDVEGIDFLIDIMGTAVILNQIDRYGPRYSLALSDDTNHDLSSALNLSPFDLIFVSSAFAKEQNRSLGGYIWDQAKKNKASYGVIAVIGYGAAGVCLAFCPPLAGPIALGTTEALGVQAANDTIYGTAHRAVDAVHASEERRENGHKNLDRTRLWTDLGQAAVGVHQGIKNYGKAVQEAENMAARGIDAAQEGYNAAWRTLDEASEGWKQFTRAKPAMKKALDEYLKRGGDPSKALDHLDDLVELEKQLGRATETAFDGIRNASENLDRAREVAEASRGVLTAAGRSPEVVKKAKEIGSDVTGAGGNVADPAAEGVERTAEEIQERIPIPASLLTQASGLFQSAAAHCQNASTTVSSADSVISGALNGASQAVTAANTAKADAASRKGVIDEANRECSNAPSDSDIEQLISSVDQKMTLVKQLSSNAMTSADAICKIPRGNMTRENIDAIGSNLTGAKGKKDAA